MNAWTVILDIVLILISIVLIIAVLLQQGQRQGLGAIAGGAETFFGKNKAKGYEAKMAKITKIGAAIFIVAAIAATIVSAHTAPGDTADITDDVVYTAEELEHDHDGDGVLYVYLLHRRNRGRRDRSARGRVCRDPPAADEAAEATDEATEAPAADVTEEATAAPTEAPAASTEEPAEEAAEEPAETVAE